MPKHLGAVESVYDKNGNMVKNLDKNISEIKYNVLNLPSQITTGEGDAYEITYTYDAQGRKLQAYYRRKTMDVIIPKRQQAKSITLSSRFDGIIGKPVLPDTLVKDTMSTTPSEAEWLSSKITYSGNLIFTGNRVTVLNPHGYTTIDTNKTTGEQTTTRYYYLKDHLGSNRVVFRGDGTVMHALPPTQLPRELWRVFVEGMLNTACLLDSHQA